ncbi:SAM-dependent methyltransferase [Chloroflexia bacterium SDU3-3]|nr:SAM-dependent methyltransferase [Chloroflexia bacterium SDU3-3]
MLETTSFTTRIDQRRLAASSILDPKLRAERGQFLTPGPIARFMASLFQPATEAIHLLDAGAGVGSLTAAAVATLCQQTPAPRTIAATAYEIDHQLTPYLEETLADCAALCAERHVRFASSLRSTDFIAHGAQQLFMRTAAEATFTHAILNPPYRKITTHSADRQHLRSIGIETSNLYAGFLALAIKLLAPGGELVAIVPRSFCNGPYFRPFRQLLLKEMALTHIHLFESRTDAFRDDGILQENIIFHAIKQQTVPTVIISRSAGADLAHSERRLVSAHEIVHPSDPDQMIHITADSDAQLLVRQMQDLPCTLADLGIDASTGPVVDFRLADFLRAMPASDSVPLIYPQHCRDYHVHWPLPGAKKPNALDDHPQVRKWLYPNGHYVVVRRLSSKEEPHRIVASLYDPARIPGDWIGFENHLNVFHQDRHGLAPDLALGLTRYLNTTLVDICFRQFSGHTQVNVSDLARLRYPTAEALAQLGRRDAPQIMPDQRTLDTWLGEIVS